jgi:hypothetical protein
MASADDPCPEYPERTRRSDFRYCFYVKHHGRGAPNASQWAEDVSRQDEFGIFDEADWHDLSDSEGDLYGLRRSAEGDLLDLGTHGEQIAKFWRPSTDNQPTHGFPMWPVAEDSSDNRKKQSAPVAALSKMVEQGLLLPSHYKRLRKGKYA